MPKVRIRDTITVGKIWALLRMREISKLQGNREPPKVGKAETQTQSAWPQIYMI